MILPKNLFGPIFHSPSISSVVCFAILDQYPTDLAIDAGKPGKKGS